MKVNTVVFEALKSAVLKTEDFNPVLTGDQVLTENDYSAISAGTELANFLVLPNTVAFVSFPFYPGYSTSGHVIQVGPDVKNLKIGDRVAIAWGGHRSHNVKRENDVVKIEDDSIDMKVASFTHISSFAFLGVRKLKIQLGESALVAGQGLLGLIAAQLARLSGAYPVIAADYSPERRALALKFGADYALSPGEPDFIGKVKELTGDKGVNAIVEVTGSAAALQQALEYVAWEGRISLLGCTRISDVPIDFYKYVHRRGISLIGAHTFTRPSVDSYPGEWTEHDDYRTFLKLVSAGKLQIAPIISEVVSPADAGKVYMKLAETKNPPFGILFDWSKIR